MINLLFFLLFFHLCMCDVSILQYEENIEYIKSSNFFIYDESEGIIILSELCVIPENLDNFQSSICKNKIAMTGNLNLIYQIQQSDMDFDKNLNGILFNNSTNKFFINSFKKPIFEVNEITYEILKNLPSGKYIILYYSNLDRNYKFILLSVYILTGVSRYIFLFFSDNVYW